MPPICTGPKATISSARSGSSYKTGSWVSEMPRSMSIGCSIGAGCSCGSGWICRINKTGILCLPGSCISQVHIALLAEDRLDFQADLCPDTEWLPAVSHRLMQMGLPIARAPYARLPHPDRNLFIRPSPAMATASGHRTATVPPPAASGSPSAWTTQQPREIPAEKVAYVPDPHQAQAVGNQIDSPGLRKHVSVPCLEHR